MAITTSADGRKMYKYHGQKKRKDTARSGGVEEEEEKTNGREQLEIWRFRRVKVNEP